MIKKVSVQAIFTIPDSDLTQESSVDPMGIQPIWTFYGQSIFGERLTTVANDLRIFTFNLFHQHLLYRLYTEYAEDVENAKAYYRDWVNSMDVKTGLLIFLEDVVTWVFYEAKDKEQESVSVLGILGLSKARMAFNASDRNPIVLHAHKRFGLLKNQLNLGMTGRYKGPMMKMGFFDRAFEIKDSQNPEWDRVERLMQDWNEALELQDKLLQLITDVLFEASKKDHPQLLLTDLKAKAIWKKIYAGYLACFGSDQQRRSIRDFWKDKLGLGRGAAAALYMEIAKVNKDDFINHEFVFRQALKHVDKEKEEKQKLNSILQIEPFLSHTEYLLRFLAQNSIKKITDHTVQLKQIREVVLQSASFNTDDAPVALKNLYPVMIADVSMHDWLRGILDYHKRIMTQRGGSAWLEMDADGNIKHYYAPVLSESLDTIQKYLHELPWLHTYYLETVRSIHKGLK